MVGRWVATGSFSTLTSTPADASTHGLDARGLVWPGANPGLQRKGEGEKEEKREAKEKSQAGDTAKQKANREEKIIWNKNESNEHQHY